MNRLPKASGTGIIAENSSLHRMIGLQIRQMREILSRFYAMQRLSQKLPSSPEFFSDTEDEFIGFTCQKALGDSIDLGLIRLFGKGRNLGFGRIIKEYALGINDKQLVRKMNKAVSIFGSNYQGLTKMRNELLAHQDPNLELNSFQTFVKRKEAINDALGILDLFLEGKLAFVLQLQDEIIDLREIVENESI